MHRALLKCAKSFCSSGAKRRSGCGFNYIANQIKISGPMTVAEYMKLCLLHPMFGYYMQGDVFGEKGDFTTAPEVSQTFGELIGVWILADWKSRGEKVSLQLVELGPGRGTLLSDILRVFGHKQLSSILQVLSVHLVEASPALASIQAHTLQAKAIKTTTTTTTTTCYQNAIVAEDIQVSWYRTLQDVPHGHSYMIAQEFFDALPIHQFQWTSLGWREVLVDLDHTHNPPAALRFVLASHPTLASTAYTTTAPKKVEKGAWFEVCPQGLLFAQEIADRVVKGGGAALVADYRGKGNSNTLRAHELHDVLTDPGAADLTANVDFTALARVASDKGAGCFGPISQNEFLHRLGIRQRIEALMKGASPSHAKDLVSGYEMLTSPYKMGDKFQMLTITSSPHHVPVPFFNDVPIM